MNDFSICGWCGHTYTSTPEQLLDNISSKTSMTFSLQIGRMVGNTLKPPYVAAKGCRMGGGSVWTSAEVVLRGRWPFLHTWKRPFVFLKTSQAALEPLSRLLPFQGFLPLKDQMCGISPDRVLCFWWQRQSHGRILKLCREKGNTGSNWKKTFIVFRT